MEGKATVTDKAKPDAYENADFYSCNEGDGELCHTSEEDAIIDHLDDVDVPDGQSMQQWRSNGTVTVYAFKIREWSTASRRRHAKAAIDALESDLYDEFSGVDDGSNLFDDEARQCIVATFLALSMDGGRCDPCGQREYKGEALAQMVSQIYATTTEDGQ